MTKINLPLLMLLISCCQDKYQPLTEVLGQHCRLLSDDSYVEVEEYTSVFNNFNIGSCTTGTVQKDAAGTKVCIGFIRKTEETCNGADDDCNGLIDDSEKLDHSFFDSENTCNDTAMGVCIYTEHKCIFGTYVCVPPNNFGKEICDNADNDCDGKIDEDTYEDPIFLAVDRYVYTGDPDTINVGECRAGYKECVDGNVFIRNMRTPVVEICGNDDDDDCDGLADELEGDDISSDTVLIIDYSGSMGDIITSVADAVCDWSSQGALSNSRFAVIGVGYHDQSTGPAEIKILSDFTDSDTACNIIRQNNNSQYGGSTELQIDAIFNANDPSAAYGYLSWISSNKNILVFTDELIQQTIALTVLEAIEIVSDQCYDEQYTIGAFIKYNISDQALWVDLTQRCGGFLDYLSNDSTQMIQTLNYWIGADCQSN